MHVNVPVHGPAAAVPARPATREDPPSTETT